MSEDNKTRKRNILQIVPALNCGGVERGTIDIAKAISISGNNSYVLSSGGILCKQIKDIKNAHLIKHNVSSKNPITIIRNISYIRNLIEAEKIDLVHARSRAPAWSAYYAAKKLDIPYVTTFHGIYSMQSQLKKYYNSIMTKGDKVIAVSEFVKNHILENYEIDENKITVIYRGVDLDYFNPQNCDEKLKNKFTEKYNLPNSVPLIILPSRLTSWKGQNILIKALAEIKKLDFYCLLVGDLSNHPSYVDSLNTLIRENKLQSKVQIFGSEMDIVGLYDRADIVVSSSVEPEAFGRTIVEAQAMAKIVVATNIGGSAETIEDGVTGFHVKPNDHIAMSLVIKAALSILGTMKADEMTSNARKSVAQHFSLDRMQKDTLSLYSTLI